MHRAFPRPASSAAPSTYTRLLPCTANTYAPTQGFVFSRMGWAIDLLDDVRQLISTTLWNLLDGGPTTAVPGAAVPLSVPETTATLEDLRSAVAASLNLSGEDGKPRMLGSANGKKAA